MRVAADLAGRTLALVRRAAAAVAILCFVVMMLGVLVQVGGRYLFNYSIAGADEIATFAQVWMVLLGGGIAMRRGQHVAVDLLPSLLPLRLARVVSLFIAAGALWFLAIVVKGSLPLLELGMAQTSSALILPMWVIYLSLPIGAVYFGVEIVATIVQRWDRPFGLKASADSGDRA